MSRQGLTGPLRFREFRLLFFGQLISNLGDWLDFLALIVLITFVWHDGAGALAALAVVVAAPSLVAGPIAGVWADRLPKRTVMVSCDLIRALVVVGLIFAPNLAVLLVLVAAKNIVSTLFSPAQQAAIGIVVPKEQLLPANALSQLALQATKVVGPAVGGVLVGLSTPRTAFGVDAATFVASAVILSRMRRIEVLAAAPGPAAAPPGGEPAAAPELAAAPSTPAKPPSFWQELREGVAYVVGSRILLVTIGGLSFATFLLLAFDTLSPLALMQLGVNKTLFGVAVGAVGFGSVVGAAVIGRSGNRFNPSSILGLSKILVGGLVTAIGLLLVTDVHPPPESWIAVLFLLGFAAAGIFVSAPTIILQETPAALLGRVSSTAGAIPTVFQVAGPIIGAAVAAWQSVGFVFTTAGIGLVLVGAVVVLLRQPANKAAPAATPEPSTTPQPDTGSEPATSAEQAPIPESRETIRLFPEQMAATGALVTVVMAPPLPPVPDASSFRTARPEASVPVPDAAWFYRKAKATRPLPTSLPGEAPPDGHEGTAAPPPEGGTQV